MVENLGAYELAAQLLVQSDLGGGTFLNGGLFRRTATGTLGGITLTTTNSGSMELKAGTTTFGDLVQTGGTFQLLGGNAKVTQFDVNGGTVAGSGKIDGPVRNHSGTVAPGSSPGFLQFASFVNGTNGTVSLELAAGAGGVDFDQVRVSGTATLAGTLALTFLPDYTPNLSDTFTVITAGTRTGQFGSLINPAGAQLEAT